MGIRRRINRKGLSQKPSTPNPDMLQHFLQSRPFGDGKKVRSPQLPTSADIFRTRPFAPHKPQSAPPEETPDVPAQLNSGEEFGYSGFNMPAFAPSEASPIQAKLTIGEPGDRYEQEADSVAAQVVSQINSPPPQESAASQTVQREDMLKEDEEKPVQTSLEISTIQREEIPPPEEDEDKQPLQTSLESGTIQRDEMPPQEEEEEPVQAKLESGQARAFTTGQDIFFRQGQYDPGSKGGQELLAHELTHVVQQNGANEIQRSNERDVHQVSVSQTVPQTVPLSIQRLQVSINSQIVDIKKEDLGGNQKIAELFARLQLNISEGMAADQTLSDTQKQLNKIKEAIDLNSVNKDVFFDVLSSLIDGKKADWTAWDDLEMYKKAVQPIIDERDNIKRDKATYLQWYHQNLKDKGMDYEELVNTFVQNNAYGMGMAEAHAIFGYTSILYYKKLNELLLAGEKQEKTALLKGLLEKALAKLPLETDIQYRAMNITPEPELDSFLKKHQEGEVVSYGQFSSAAKYPVQPFWEEGNIRLIIKPNNARNITELAFGVHFMEIITKGERKNDTHESLFPPTAKFLVTGVSETNEQRTEKNKETGKETTKNVTVYTIEMEQTS